MIAQLTSPKLCNGTKGIPPAADQIEVSLFGPGFGESILVHVGNGQWVLVDSCIDNTSSSQEPVALRYLEALGVNPRDSVNLIVATHWHDDHIRGIARLLEVCTNARFCTSSALGRKEFIAMVKAYDQQLLSKCTSGIREINKVHEILLERSASRQAAADRRVLALAPQDSGHGYGCTVTTLSPSDRQIERFHYEIAALMPQVGRTKKRCTPQGPNRLAVVTWIELGPMALLLGSDLEETGEAETGWSAIVTSTTRPAGRATVYKVAHHGASSAHHGDIWNHMLIETPFAILTPFNRGLKLPARQDVARICGLTPEAYVTASLARRRARKRNQAVERTLREANIVITRAEPPTGLLRLRNNGKAAFDVWNLEMINGACPLADVHV